MFADAHTQRCFDASTPFVEGFECVECVGSLLTSLFNQLCVVWQKFEGPPEPPPTFPRAHNTLFEKRARFAECLIKLNLDMQLIVLLNLLVLSPMCAGMSLWTTGHATFIVNLELLNSNPIPARICYTATIPA